MQYYYNSKNTFNVLIYFKIYSLLDKININEFYFIIFLTTATSLTLEQVGFCNFKFYKFVFSFANYERKKIDSANNHTKLLFVSIFVLIHQPPWNTVAATRNGEKVTRWRRIERDYEACIAERTTTIFYRQIRIVTGARSRLADPLNRSTRTISALHSGFRDDSRYRSINNETRSVPFIWKLNASVRWCLWFSSISEKTKGSLISINVNVF